MPIIQLNLEFGTEKTPKSLNKAIANLFKNKKAVKVERLIKILQPAGNLFIGTHVNFQQKTEPVAVFGMALNFLPQDYKIELHCRDIGTPKKRLRKKRK